MDENIYKHIHCFLSLFPFVLRQRKVAKPVNLQKDALPHTHIYLFCEYPKLCKTSLSEGFSCGSAPLSKNPNSVNLLLSSTK